MASIVLGIDALSAFGISALFLVVGGLLKKIYQYIMVSKQMNEMGGIYVVDENTDIQEALDKIKEDEENE